MLNQWTSTSVFDLQRVWEVKHLGFGNTGLVRERRGQQQQALVEFFRIQDLVAAQVADSHAELEAAYVRTAQAEVGLKSALRPQEVVAALQQLDQAYRNYFLAVQDYNRAQFRLFHDIDFNAQILACDRQPGPPLPADTSRPPPMAPACAPEPCRGR